MTTNYEKRRRNQVRIGREIYAAIQPVIARNAGLQVVCAYTTPHPKDPEKFKVSLVSSIDDPKLIVLVLASAGRDVKEQMIDPFFVKLEEGN